MPGRLGEGKAPDCLPQRGLLQTPAPTPDPHWVGSGVLGTCGHAACPCLLAGEGPGDKFLVDEEAGAQ